MFWEPDPLLTENFLIILDLNQLQRRSRSEVEYLFLDCICGFEVDEE